MHTLTRRIQEVQNLIRLLFRLKNWRLATYERSPERAGRNQTARQIGSWMDFWSMGPVLVYIFPSPRSFKCSAYTIRIVRLCRGETLFNRYKYQLVLTIGTSRKTKSFFFLSLSLRLECMYLSNENRTMEDDAASDQTFKKIANRRILCILC